MFSYRHAFHAGNHADVLKHIVLLHALRHFVQKEAPFWFIDTHAGAGLYALDGDWASQREEYRDGIGGIWGRSDAPPLVADYLQTVRSFNADANLRRYPGSPFVALNLLRPQDRLRLFEAHLNESRVLKGNIEAAGRDAIRRTEIRAGDGFAGLKGLLPPLPRRALVLIDPSYEDKEDYRRVATALGDALRRFATGCYVIWYPLIQRREARALPGNLMRKAERWLHVTLGVRSPPPDGLGLYGSGLVIVNPPWTLQAALSSALPWLATALVEPGGDGWTLDVSRER